MKKYLTLAILSVCTATSAQKMKIKDGNFDFLKGQKEVNVEFRYNDMTLLKKKLPEEQYIMEHSAELEKNPPAKGKPGKKVGRQHVN